MCFWIWCQIVETHMVNILFIQPSWRRPKGIDSRVRRKFKGCTLMPNIGYGSDKKTRHYLPNRFKKFVVNNVSDLELLMMHNRYAIWWTCWLIAPNLIFIAFCGLTCNSWNEMPGLIAPRSAIVFLRRSASSLSNALHNSTLLSPTSLLGCAARRMNKTDIFCLRMLLSNLTQFHFSSCNLIDRNGCLNSERCVLGLVWLTRLGVFVSVSIMSMSMDPFDD